VEVFPQPASRTAQMTMEHNQFLMESVSP